MLDAFIDYGLVRHVGLERNTFTLCLVLCRFSFNRIVCDIHRLPFADGTFDVAFCRAMLHHVDDLGAALAESTASGGVHVIDVPIDFEQNIGLMQEMMMAGMST